MTTPISRAAVLEILRTPAASDTFTDMIRRVEALEGCGVRVKALEWRDDMSHRFYAVGVPTAVIIDWSRLDGFGARFQYGATEYDTLEAAKAAAQADYEARTLSALEPIAQPETPTPGQFTTMCLAPDDAIAKVEALRKERDAGLQREADANAAAFRHKAERDRLAAELAAAHDKYQRDVFGLNNEGDPIGGNQPSGLKQRADTAEAGLAAANAREAGLRDALNMAKKHMIVNDLSLPNVFAVIDAALAQPSTEGGE